MNRRRVVLLILLLFLLAVKSRVSQAQTGIALHAPGAYSLFLVETISGCEGSLFLAAPVEKLITDQTGVFPAGYEVGRFNEGQELVFKLTADCLEDDLYSNRSEQVEIIPDPDSLSYLLIWKSPLAADEDGVVSLMRLGLNEPGLPSRHPVIFVHGLGGHYSDWYPANWDEDYPERGNKAVYFETLSAAPYDYPQDFLHAYAYSDADGKDETYDNQGDIVKISKGMKGAVDEMADLYYLGCEEECVDLVGFSLGGIVIRQYLNEHPNDHKVRKAITIASPHRGVWVLSPFGFIESIPIRGQLVRDAVGVAASKLGGLIGADIDFSSDAVKQITPGHDYVKNLNNEKLDTPQFTTIYGDIDMRIIQKIFHFELISGKVSLGDPIILPNSATGVPTTQNKTIEFSDPNILDFELKPSKLESTYSFEVDILGLDDLKYEHRKLITESGVVDAVLKDISQ